MSLKAKEPEQIPAMTVQVAKAAFPKGNIYMSMRDHFGIFFTDELFQGLYSHTGQPAKSPWRLALLTIMQFCENLSDRQTADALRSRIDWKYALSLELTDPGFDHTVLTKFRKRLVEEEQQTILFDVVLQSLVEHGLVSSGGAQRTDSTHILSSVRELNRLESLGETMRAALNALSLVVPHWIQAHIPDDWFLRYDRPFEEFRLPKKEKERDKLILQLGKDGYLLLDWIYESTDFPWLKEVPAVDFLRRKWIQNFSQDSDGQTRKRDTVNMPKSSDLLQSPHDEDARCGRKRELRWVGYKVHFTESCDEEKPRLLTHIETTKATTNDIVVLQQIHEKLEEKELVPSEHLVDMGYTNGKQLVESEKRGIQLIGPLAPITGWQSSVEGGMTQDQFAIDWEHKVATCPMNKTSYSWREEKTNRGTPVSKIRFDKKDCDGCSARERCTKARVYGRSLKVLPKEEFLQQQERKKEQESKEFLEKYKKRGGVEGVHSQGVRLGLRRSRYRGFEKTKLQHYAIGAAINIKRAMSWLCGLLLTATRSYHFNALAPV